MRPAWLDKAEYARLREIGKAELRSRGLPIRATFLDVATASQWLGERLKVMGKPDEYRALMGAMCGRLCAMKMAPWEVAKAIVDCHHNQSFSEALVVARVDAIETAKDPNAAVFFPPLILNDATSAFVDDLVRMKGDKATVVVYVKTPTTRVKIQASEVDTLTKPTKSTNT